MSIMTRREKKISVNGAPLEELLIAEKILAEFHARLYGTAYYWHARHKADPISNLVMRVNGTRQLIKETIKIETVQRHLDSLTIEEQRRLFL